MSKQPGVPKPTGATTGQVEDDAQLVARVRTGDGGAFDQLVRCYQRQAVAVAYRFVGNGADAADVAQDAMFRAYRNLDQLAEAGRFGPWLLRIVTNLSLNHRRSRKGKATTGLDEWSEMVSPLGDRGRGQAQPGDRARNQELRAAVRAAIDDLPEKQQVAFVMSAIEGVPQSDIAEVLECTIELVKWHVFQARKALRQKLAGWADDDRF